MRGKSLNGPGKSSAHLLQKERATASLGSLVANVRRMPGASTLDLLATVSQFFVQQASTSAEQVLERVGARDAPSAPAPTAAPAAAAAARSAAATPVSGMGAAGRAAGAAAATFATGWAVSNNKIPPATEILSYAILEAAAELKVKAERRVFLGSNVALGVLLVPFHVLSCGLRALGWARVMVRPPKCILCALAALCCAPVTSLCGLVPVCDVQPEGARPLGSTADSADAQHLRFVQRELADLKAELTWIREAAQNGSTALSLAAPPVSGGGGPAAAAAAAAPAATPNPRAGLAPAPPPPPPPPPLAPPGLPSAVKSTPAAAARPPPPADTPGDLDGKTDLMAAIRAAGGNLRKAAAPSPAAAQGGSAAETTPSKLGDGRPDMRSIVPSTPPTLRKAVDHSPGGTPMPAERALFTAHR